MHDLANSHSTHMLVSHNSIGTPGPMVSGLGCGLLVHTTLSESGHCLVGVGPSVTVEVDPSVTVEVDPSVTVEVGLQSKEIAHG